MVKLDVIKIYVLILIVIISSCSKDTITKEISFFNGIYSPVNYNDGYAFLCNLQEYYNKPSLVNIDKYGNVKSLYLIDAYKENITLYPYFKLFNNQGRLVLIYKKMVGQIIIKDIITKNNISLINLKNNSYGTLIQIDDQSAYIKSGYNYGSTNFKGYKYSCYRFDKNLNKTLEKVMDLGAYQPKGLAFIDNNIFYYKGNNILYLMNIDKKEEISLYKFPNEIVETKTYSSKYYVLLESSLFIFNNKGEVLKGFRFNSEDGLYKATTFNINKKSIVVTLDNNKNQKVKLFSNNGNQIKELKISKPGIVGDTYINIGINENLLLYTKDRYLHLKEF